MSRVDDFTNYPEDAAWFEQQRGRDEAISDRAPTRVELAAEEGGA